MTERPGWPVCLYTPEGDVDWDAMTKAYNARKREARRNGKPRGIEQPITPRNDPFFPVFGE